MKKSDATKMTKHFMHQHIVQYEQYAHFKEHLEVLIEKPMSLQPEITGILSEEQKDCLEKQETFSVLKNKVHTYLNAKKKAIEEGEQIDQLEYLAQEWEGSLVSEYFQEVEGKNLPEISHYLNQLNLTMGSLNQKFWLSLSEIQRYWIQAQIDAQNYLKAMYEKILLALNKMALDRKWV